MATETDVGSLQRLVLVLKFRFCYIIDSIILLPRLKVLEHSSGAFWAHGKPKSRCTMVMHTIPHPLKIEYLHQFTADCCDFFGTSLILLVA